MKFKSPVLSAVSGAVAGLVGSHNQGGMYFRARAMPTDPATAFQQAIRTAVTQLSTAWSSELTQAQRDGWEVYATNVPLTDVFGDARTRSGEQHYIRSNVPRLQIGAARVDVAPTLFDLGSFDFALTGAIAVNTLQVDIGDSAAWREEPGSYLIVQTSRPQSAGINFFKGPWRLGDTIQGDETTPPADTETVDAAFDFAIDSKVFVRARVTRADGRLSGAVVASIVATM